MKITTPIQKASAAAKATGLQHFLLATKNNTSVTIHFEDVSIKNAMEIMIAGFHQLVQMDLEKNPHYSKQVREVYGNLQKNFDSVIRGFNTSLNTVNKKQSKK